MLLAPLATCTLTKSAWWQSTFAQHNLTLCLPHLHAERTNTHTYTRRYKTKTTHTCTHTQIPHTHCETLTEVCRIVVGGTVQAQVLQVGNEVGDGALVYALALAQNVQLERRDTHRYDALKAE